MATYTTRREERDQDKIEFTKTEAAAVLQAGFRFAEFSTESDQYRLLIPTGSPTTWIAAHSPSSSLRCRNSIQAS